MAGQGGVGSKVGGLVGLGTGVGNRVWDEPKDKGTAIERETPSGDGEERRKVTGGRGTQTWLVDLAASVFCYAPWRRDWGSRRREKRRAGEEMEKERRRGEREPGIDHWAGGSGQKGEVVRDPGPEEREGGGAERPGNAGAFQNVEKQEVASPRPCPRAGSTCPRPHLPITRLLLPWASLAPGSCPEGNRGWCGLLT